MNDEIKIGDKVEIIRNKVIHGVNLIKGEIHEITYIGITGKPYVKGPGGFNVILREGEYKKLEDEKVPTKGEFDIQENEFIPKFFKRNDKYSDPEDEYFHTKDNIYIEVPPERYVEYDFGEDVILDGDVVLYTDCEHTILVYYRHEIEKYFEEVK